MAGFRQARLYHLYQSSLSIQRKDLAVPKPCSKPLTQNPYETYRDPVTGQWKVRYPAQTQSHTETEKPIETNDNIEEAPKRRTKRRQWKKTSETKVA